MTSSTNVNASWLHHSSYIMTPSRSGKYQNKAKTFNVSKSLEFFKTLFCSSPFLLYHHLKDTKQQKIRNRIYGVPRTDNHRFHGPFFCSFLHSICTPKTAKSQKFHYLEFNVSNSAGCRSHVSLLIRISSLFTSKTAKHQEVRGLGYDVSKTMQTTCMFFSPPPPSPPFCDFKSSKSNQIRNPGTSYEVSNILNNTGMAVVFCVLLFFFAPSSICTSKSKSLGYLDMEYDSQNQPNILTRLFFHSVPRTQNHHAIYK
jgi:hypothetical protein